MHDYFSNELVDRTDRSRSCMCALCLCGAMQRIRKGARQCRMSLQILLSIIHFFRACDIPPIEILRSI